MVHVNNNGLEQGKKGLTTRDEGANDGVDDRERLCLSVMFGQEKTNRRTSPAQMRPAQVSSTSHSITCTIYKEARSHRRRCCCCLCRLQGNSNHLQLDCSVARNNKKKKNHDSVGTELLLLLFFGWPEAAAATLEARSW